jgi:hypothetical protein
LFRRRILIGAGLVLLVVAWAAFRPELLFVNESVNETLESAGTAPASAAAGAVPTELATGMFRSGAHETSGTATVFRLANGERVLRLSDFATSNGPDVHIYLVAAKDVKDNATVKSAGYVDLGSLKGNVGDQNYAVPAGIDLDTYRAVTVWCARFSVNFGTAPLVLAQS